MNEMTIKQSSAGWKGAVLTCATLLLGMTGSAQALDPIFDSGSDGSDGALEFTTPGTIIFDPRDYTRPDGQRLDPDGDGVYHFTSITVASGVTLRLKAVPMGTKPVIWLASGDVVLNGNLNLRGENGHLGTEVSRIAVGGAGGYEGGMGGFVNVAPTPGSGPGGGKIKIPYNNKWGAGASHVTDGWYNTSGKTYGNVYLMPLIGGSGGGGGIAGSGLNRGGGGGGGGGALLIASSTRVVLNGWINAEGGDGGYEMDNAGRGGGGSGGVVRIITSSFEGNGAISVYKGRIRDLNNNLVNTNPSGSHGRIRIEAYDYNFTGTYYGTESGSIRIVTPGKVFPVNNTAPEVRVVSVAGVPVPADAVASFSPPDLEINSTGSVTFEIEATNVPVGTVVKLRMVNETNGVVEFNSTPLAGTFESSTATASTTIPHGYSRFNLSATF